MVSQSEFTRFAREIDSRVHRFAGFTFWRRAATVYNVMKLMDRLARIPELKSAMCAVTRGRYLLDAIHTHLAHLKEFAHAYRVLDGDMKRMLCAARRQVREMMEQ